MVHFEILQAVVLQAYGLVNDSLSVWQVSLFLAPNRWQASGSSVIEEYWYSSSKIVMIAHEGDAFQPWDCIIYYVPGKQLVFANAPSRKP